LRNQWDADRNASVVKIVVEDTEETKSDQEHPLAFKYMVNSLLHQDY